MSEFFVLFTTYLKIKTKIMAECKPQCQEQPSEMDFDIARTFTVLTAVLILPVYLSLSVVSYSLGAII